MSNQNTNTHVNKANDFDDQEDILSDYIPQSAEKERYMNKASEENLGRNRYMQSIEEVEDELFDKLRS